MPVVTSKATEGIMVKQETLEEEQQSAKSEVKEEEEVTALTEGLGQLGLKEDKASGEEDDDDEEEECIQSVRTTTVAKASSVDSQAAEIESASAESADAVAKVAEEKEDKDERQGDGGGADAGLYTSKGPMRRHPDMNGGHVGTTPKSYPYQRPSAGMAGSYRNNDANFDLVSIGQFLDEIYPELNLDQLSPTSSSSLSAAETGIPGLPAPKTGGSVNQLLMNSIDNVFGAEGASSRIILRNEAEDSGFSLLPTPLSMVVDEHHNRMGINIPRQVIPAAAVTAADTARRQMEIYIQLDPHVTRVIRVVASIEESTDKTGRSAWVIRSQFLRLQPFLGESGLVALLDGVSSAEVEAAHALVAAKSMEELLKTYGPNQDTILMVLCCKKDSPSVRAQVLAVTKRLLASTDPAVRSNIVQKNSVGSTALDYTGIFNKPAMGRFLAEVYYDMGENLTSPDPSGNTILHLMARKGDDVTQTLQTFLELRFHGQRKVYPSNLRNARGEMPVHIAAMNQKCHQRTIQLLYHDEPTCFNAMAEDGSLPIHYACQFSCDPTLIATLLYYNRNVVNARRMDGFTPLHLIAARSDVDDAGNKLIPLLEDTQIRMVRLLLDHGADKTLMVESYLPMHLLKPDRTKVKLLLKLKRGEGGSGSRQNSPTSVSPPAANQLPHEGVPSPALSASSAMSSASSGFGSGVDMSPAPSSANGSPPPLSDSPSLYGGGNGYQLQNSPFGAGGSVSSGGGGGQSGSDSEDSSLDAIAEVLFQHPTIQAVMDMQNQQQPF